MSCEWEKWKCSSDKGLFLLVETILPDILFVFALSCSRMCDSGTSYLNFKKESKFKTITLLNWINEISQF